MNRRVRGTVKGCVLYLKPIALVFIYIGITQLFINIIVSYFTDTGSSQSVANIMSTFLIAMAIAVPLYYFKQIMELGANRRDYYYGTIVTYLLFAVLLTVVNLLMYYIELFWLNNYIKFDNMIELLSWNQAGLPGIVLYQLGMYLSIIFLLNFFFSGIKLRMGIILNTVLVIFIIFVIATPGPRALLERVLLFLFFNPNMTLGFISAILISIVMLSGGWLFTRKREVSS